MNATVEFFLSLGQATRDLERSQTSTMHVENLREPLMLPSFSILGVGHSVP